jgi:hypothetical protein
MTLALWSIGIGGVLGAAIVCLILLKQGQDNVNSLASLESALGRWGEVEVALDASNRGKVTVEVKGAVLSLVAFTDDSGGFQVGDRVLIVQVHKGGVWVVGALQT